MSETKYKSIGFVGLGAMGLPMATNLANKLPEETRIHVYDISKASIKQIRQDCPEKVQEATSAKDVADNSVTTPLILLCETKLKLCE